MKNILGNIFSKGASELVEKVGDAFDKNFTSKEERDAKKNELIKSIQDFDLQMQSELTERLKIDMTSDNKLSKSIRPLTLIFILLLYTVFSLMDGNINGFVINDNYVELLGQWGMLIMSFYFGGRTVEKAFKMIGKKNK